MAHQSLTALRGMDAYQVSLLSHSYFCVFLCGIKSSIYGCNPFWLGGIMDDFIHRGRASCAVANFRHTLRPTVGVCREDSEACRAAENGSLTDVVCGRLRLE